MVKIHRDSSNSSFVRLFYKRLAVIQFVLIVNLCYAQSSIVATGTANYTVGEVFPVMQQLDTIEKYVTLSAPKFETEQPKLIVKKKPLTWWQKLIKAIFG